METVFQLPSAFCRAASETVDLALMMTFSGSMNGRIAASGVDARAVSQLAGTQ